MDYSEGYSGLDVPSEDSTNKGDEPCTSKKSRESEVKSINDDDNDDDRNSNISDTVEEISGDEYSDDFEPEELPRVSSTSADKFNSLEIPKPTNPVGSSVRSTVQSPKISVQKGELVIFWQKVQNFEFFLNSLIVIPHYSR